MPIPRLVAHRGYTLHYPENTLVAVEAAIAAGARFVEVDVQLSRDKVPVLFHDRSLKRVCGVDGAVHERTWGELQQVRAREYDRFGHRYAQVELAAAADLAQLLTRFPQVTAFIEIKRIALEQFGVAPVLRCAYQSLKPVIERCVVISYALEALADARRQGWPAVGVVISRWHERQAPIMDEIGAEYLFCELGGLPRFGRLDSGDAKLAVFEITDARLALKLAARGVEFVETFAVGEMRRDLELLSGGPA